MAPITPSEGANLTCVSKIGPLLENEYKKLVNRLKARDEPFALAQVDDEKYIITTWNTDNISNIRKTMQTLVVKINDLSGCVWTRKLHRLLWSKFQNLEARDLENHEPFGEDEIHNYECKIFVSAVGKMGDEEKDEYIDDHFEEIKRIEALPEFASSFLENFGYFYTQDYTLRDKMYERFSAWIGKKFNEVDVPPEQRSKLVDRFSRNTFLDENGVRLPWPLCYECGKHLLDKDQLSTGKEYCNGKCQAAGKTRTCDCGSTSVTEKRTTWDRKFWRVSTLKEGVKRDRDGNEIETCVKDGVRYEVYEKQSMVDIETVCNDCGKQLVWGGSFMPTIPIAGTIAVDPNHVPAWKKRKRA